MCYSSSFYQITTKYATVPTSLPSSALCLAFSIVPFPSSSKDQSIDQPCHCLSASVSGSGRWLTGNQQPGITVPWTCNNIRLFKSPPRCKFYEEKNSKVSISSSAITEAKKSIVTTYGVCRLEPSNSPFINRIASHKLFSLSNVGQVRRFSRHA